MSDLVDIDDNLVNAPDVPMVNGEMPTIDNDLDVSNDADAELQETKNFLENCRVQ